MPSHYFPSNVVFLVCNVYIYTIYIIYTYIYIYLLYPLTCLRAFILATVMTNTTTVTILRWQPLTVHISYMVFVFRLKQEMKFQQLVEKRQLHFISFSLKWTFIQLDRSYIQIEVLQKPSVLFQLKIIIIKSANKDLFNSPMH